jgi:hypothetical protein
MEFLEKHIPPTYEILDLGVNNPLAELMRAKGYSVSNTKEIDLDIDYRSLIRSRAKVLTAFEIFEHLLTPFNILLRTNASMLVATVPLTIWFSKAHRNRNQKQDSHFHEFEDWQFDWLLEKTGWKILDCEKWTSPTKITGVRPLLRNFVPRHYAVYAIRGQT